MATSSSEEFKVRPLDVPALFKEAGYVAVVVLGLTIGLVGFKTEDVPGGLDIVTRFGQVIFATAVAFAGRVGFILLRERRFMPVLIGAGLFSAVMLTVLVGSIVAGQRLDHHGDVKTIEVMNLTLSFDHDIVDGGPAARFSRDLISALQDATVLITARPP